MKAVCFVSVKFSKVTVLNLTTLCPWDSVVKHSVNVSYH